MNGPWPGVPTWPDPTRAATPLFSVAPSFDSIALRPNDGYTSRRPWAHDRTFQLDLRRPLLPNSSATLYAPRLARAWAWTRHWRGHSGPSEATAIEYVGAAVCRRVLNHDGIRASRVGRAGNVDHHTGRTDRRRIPDENGYVGQVARYGK